MRKGLSIFVLVLIVCISKGQLNIKTILPDKPIIAGEPFRIQFVVENPENNHRFNAPDFNGLKIIRGPEIYAGTQSINGKKIQIRNYIYTLVAEKAGGFAIDAPAVNFDGKSYAADPFIINVNRKKSNAVKWDDGSAYTLMPGEDPYKKIKENLFVKLIVSKQNCLVGEPVVATFKLFSRLQSRSDIVKNPGFYGFSVHDMINLEDKVKETERINGKDFDVHTIRKVQLYPLRAGEYLIDEIKIENKVEFSRSVVNKKTEQQISEGVLNKDDESFTPGTEIFETTLVTKPVKIKVNALPPRNIPADFNGAAGFFTIHSTVKKKQLDKNEEGFLLITIEGKGNFTQLTAPIVQWPKELEGFEPSVKDFLDKRLVPLSGARIFSYPFISSQPGKWQIPAIHFSFFNTATKNYQAISSDSVTVNISSREYKKPATETIIKNPKKTSIDEANKRVSRIAFALVVLLIVGAIVYWSFFSKRKPKEEPEAAISQPSIDDLFSPVTSENISIREFYQVMYHTTWKYLAVNYRLSGTEMNKTILTNKLEQYKNDALLITELTDMLNHFETAMFTNIGLQENRGALIAKIKYVLKQLKA